MEQAALGAAVLPVEEEQDGLFKGAVTVFHVQGQVAEEGYEFARQEQGRKDPASGQLPGKHTGWVLLTQALGALSVSLRATQAPGS